MGRKDGASTSAASLRKGPWMAEEDEVLIEYVKKYGPRDWSSIRSKGLLPRSGKSCRLRWVNKLKPDLKTGCKFSAEEERIVIELQAQFGNKWARIATYLPGRTDNDVKNFWSTRQKRLARLLQAQSGPNSEDLHRKCPSLHHEQRIVFEQGNANPLMTCEEQYSSHFESRQSPARGPLEPLSYGSALPPPDSWGGGSERNPWGPIDPPPHFSYLQLPQALLDLPLLPETHHLATDFDGVDFDPESLAHDVPEFDLFSDGLAAPPGGGGGGGGQEFDDGMPAAADGLFGDFPVEMLDGLDPPASSSQS
ncbi:unnamed protein product [Spirodela intermedia]|uniref:Uncharacterized protein n=1 Tax=Spirodela intermedia TaxID=51605 RepID=A0A7I8KBR3_SPIIN|nr:unnamed protein product [Spirodela intermedia]